MPAEVEESNAAAVSPTAMTNSEQEAAGEQLEPARNAVPTDVQDSNAAALQVTCKLTLTYHHTKSFFFFNAVYKTLTIAHNRPVSVGKTDAGFKCQMHRYTPVNWLALLQIWRWSSQNRMFAVSCSHQGLEENPDCCLQVSTEALGTGSGMQEQASGVQLETGQNAVPLDVEGSNAAAEMQSGVGDASDDSSSEDSTAGEELLQGAQAVPEAPSETNAAANSSRKAKKRKKKSLRR